MKTHLKNGLTTFQIITYDDLLKNKDLMRSVKEALLNCTEEDFEREEAEKSSWAGKTIFELLRGQSLESGRDGGGRRVEDTNGHAAVSSKTLNGDVDVDVDDVIVGRCLIEHDELPSILRQVGSKVESDDGVDKNETGQRMSLILENGSTASLRAIERGDSGEEEQISVSFVAEEVRDETLQLGAEAQPQGAPSQVAPSQGRRGDSPAPSECGGLDSKLVSGGGETQLGSSLSFAHTLIQHPALLAACYCLACLHQLTGLDFVTSLGILMAMISMVAMFFF